MNVYRHLSFAFVTSFMLSCGLLSNSSKDAPKVQAMVEDVTQAASMELTEGGVTIPDWLPEDAAERKRELMGQIDPTKHAAFVKLIARYTDGDGDYLLRRQTANAVERMIDSAKRDGVTLRVRSATRNFDRQAKIWGAKWRGERTLSNGINLGKTTLSDSAKARMILLYSSMPGTSRHHWGTDIDFNAFENDYFETEPGLSEYNWLKANGAHFGFYQPYTSKAKGRTGYEEERWHWSFRPLSLKLTELYEAEVTYTDIKGFDGAAVAPKVHAIKEYVLGLPADLLP